MQINEPFTFILNGDLVKSELTEAHTIGIKTLLKSFSGFKKGEIVIVPGDRDWADSGENGWKNVRSLEKVVKSFAFPNINWLLNKGCPGPIVMNLGENLLLVAIDTQWWNHPYDKPGPADATCKVSTPDHFKEELEDILSDNTDKNILIAGHFPVFSYGEYGGFMSIKRHIFPLTDLDESLYLPLPIIGSLYANYRRNVGTSKDIVNEEYQNLRILLENIISENSSIIYLSGHEQNMQIINKEKNYYINSGSPSVSRYARNHPEALFSKSLSGIIEVDYYNDGKVEAIIYEFSEKAGFNFYKRFDLYASSRTEKDSTVPVNTAFIPYEKEVTVVHNQQTQFDITTTVIAGEKYAAGRLRRLFFGDHYRDTWTAKVEVPYLNIDTAFGGLTPIKKGGGSETKSLKFRAGNGRRYVFRSVNKDPIKTLNYDLQKTGVVNLVRDQTSNQNPYGALATDKLLNELNILHAHPKLYILPPHEKLGAFINDFGHMLGMLEQFPANPDSGEKPFADADEIVKSHKLFRKMYQSHDNMVAVKEFALARIFDILVGDWGRHEDNWKWAGYKQGTNTIYRPIPRDRDQVFSRWDGILPWLADREWAKSSGENFDYKIDGLRSLMYQARYIDRFIANELTRDDWIQAAIIIQEKITDKIIENAVKHMPVETYQLSGKTIEEKLKSRIRDLHKYAEQYYEILAKEVDVVGSNKMEYFDVIRDEDSTVEVILYNVMGESKDKKGDKELYRRKFHPDETQEIRLFGLGSRDIFKIKGHSKNSIKIRVIGGPGKDIISDESSVTGMGKYTLVYNNDNTDELFLKNEAKNNFTAKKSSYSYVRTAFTYNTYLPIPSIGYSSDDGIFFSLGLQFTNQSFEKADYSTRHKINASVTTTGSVELDYALKFHHFFHKWDIEFAGLYANPVNYTYFYGEGNETVKDNALYRQDYYRTRYKSSQIHMRIIKDFWKQSKFLINLHLDHNEGQNDKTQTIVGQGDFFGAGEVKLIEGSMTLDLDFRNDINFPDSGTRLFFIHSNGLIADNDNSHYGKTLFFLEHFSPLTPFTIGLKAGVGDSYGEIPFYNQFFLGQNNFLRGYRNNRFTGSSIVFFNSEVRLPLIDLPTVIWPLNLGIKAFFDTGRIREKSSNQLHYGYGFGIYVLPLKKRYNLSVTFGFSEEESFLLKLSIGRIFN
jgi:hypothetical protein